MNNNAAIISFIAVLVPAQTAFAGGATMPIVCPAKLTVAQTVTAAATDGWSHIDTNEEHPFIGVSFSAGPPDRQHILAPAKEIKGKGTTTSVWEFPKSNVRYWVACQYSGTSATVARELGVNVSQCKALYDTRFAIPVVTQWKCMDRAEK